MSVSVCAAESGQQRLLPFHAQHCTQTKRDHTNRPDMVELFRSYSFGAHGFGQSEGWTDAGVVKTATTAVQRLSRKPATEIIN